MGGELVRVQKDRTVAVEASQIILPALVERAGGPPGLPGMSSSMPSITIRTRKKRINRRCGGS